MSMSKIILFPLFMLTSLACQSNDFSVIEDYVTKNKQLINLPAGTAIAIIKDQKIVYEGYFGYADIIKMKKVDSDTVFYIASMTKPFYAFLTLLKERQGLLDTSLTVKEMFPKIHLSPEIRANSVTIKDLLGHTSGIDNWPLVQATAYTGLHDSEHLTKLIGNSYENEDFPIGTYHYTNVGYNILSHWSDTRFKTRWQTMLNSDVFAPLGMENTSATMSDSKRNNWTMTQGYSVKSPNPQAPLYLKKTDQTMHAAGGVISTARDIAKFLIAMSNNGKLGSQQVFPKAVVKKSQKSLVHYSSYGNTGQYGWGWNIRKLFGETLLEHRGGFSGSSTYMSYMPKRKIGLVVLNNYDKWGGDLAYAIEDLAYALAIGKSDEEITKLVKNNEKYAREALKKYNNKPKSDYKKVRYEKHLEKLQGVFNHDLLGNIDIFRGNDGNLILRWGNLRGHLFTTPKSDKITVELVPNSVVPIYIPQLNKGDVFIEINGFRFDKLTSEK
ncbi:MAG: beta-lactamase family protein [Kangiellaceae bacterium]|nr:beta-lactamase family protein [Kangiellaceae bacterium]